MLRRRSRRQWNPALPSEQLPDQHMERKSPRGTIQRNRDDDQRQRECGG